MDRIEGQSDVSSVDTHPAGRCEIYVVCKPKVSTIKNKAVVNGSIVAHEILRLLRQLWQSELHGRYSARCIARSANVWMDEHLLSGVSGKNRLKLSALGTCGGGTSSLGTICRTALSGPLTCCLVENEGR